MNAPSSIDPVTQDLARVAIERACTALMDSVGLCDTPQQATQVAIAVAAAVAAAAHGAINNAAGEGNAPVDGYTVLEEIAALIRDAKRTVQ